MSSDRVRPEVRPNPPPLRLLFDTHQQKRRHGACDDAHPSYRDVATVALQGDAALPAAIPRTAGTLAHLMHTLKTWASDPLSGEGGFGIAKSRLRKADDKKGPQQYMQCVHRDCPFRVCYELTRDESWVLHGAQLEHGGHSFHKTSNEARADSACNSLHPEVEELLHICCAAGDRPSAAIAKLSKKAELLNIPVTWTSDTIRNKAKAYAGNRKLDPTSLGDYLIKRRDDEGLQFSIDHDGDILSRCFFEMDDAVDEWARGGNHNVLFLDGTFGTNHVGLTLVMFCTVSSTGQTVVLAVGLLRSQGAKEYEWLFRRFHDVFKIKPAAVFTDSAIELELAFTECSTISNDIWAGSVHLLCPYHIGLNVHEHCRSTFGGDLSGWRKFYDMFWVICKNTDERSAESFGAEFQALLRLFESAAEHRWSKSDMEGIKWLKETLFTKASKWAARYTWGMCTWGAHSTQRSESENRIVKTKVNKHSLVTDLAQVFSTLFLFLQGVHVSHKHFFWQALVKINREARDKKEIFNIRYTIRTFAQPVDMLPPFLQHLRESITPFALDVLKAQYAQARHYSTGEEPKRVCPGGLDVYSVTRLRQVNEAGTHPSKNTTPNEPL